MQSLSKEHWQNPPVTWRKEEIWIHHPVRLDYWNYCTIRAATTTPSSWNSAVLTDNLQWWLCESQQNSSNRSQQQCACITVNFHSITVVIWNIHRATYHHDRQKHRRHKNTYLTNIQIIVLWTIHITIAVVHMISCFKRYVCITVWRKSNFTEFPAHSL